MPRVAKEPLKPKVQRRRPGGFRDILKITDRDPNYFYRWTLDVPGRIQDRKEQGYEIVTDIDVAGDESVDTPKKVGSALTVVRGSGTLVLMRIPMEWYVEDQKAKQDDIDALEATMAQPSGDLDYGKVLGIGRRK